MSRRQDPTRATRATWVPRRLTIAVVLAILTVTLISPRVLRPHVSPLSIATEHDGLIEIRHQVADNTNRLRAANGLVELDLVFRLNEGAQEHSDWMSRTQNFEHTNDLAAQMRQIYGDDWRYAGENIGVFGGQLSDLLTALRQSPEHRANMLKPQYRRIGVGATWTDNDRLWLTIWFEG